MKRRIAILATAVMALTAFTGCGSQQSSTSVQNEESADNSDSFSYEVNSEVNSEASADGNFEDGNRPDGGQRGKTAQVTAVDENNVTIKLASDDMPQGQDTKPEDNDADKGEIPELSFDGDEVQIEITDGMLKSMDMPNGGDKGGAPNGEKPNGEKPDGEKPDGEKPNGAETDGEKPTGEAPSGDNAEPKDKPENNFEDNMKDMDISELAVGDVVNVMYEDDGTTVKYIVKSEMPQN